MIVRALLQETHLKPRTQLKTHPTANDDYQTAVIQFELWRNRIGFLLHLQTRLMETELSDTETS